MKHNLGTSFIIAYCQIGTLNNDPCTVHNCLCESQISICSSVKCIPNFQCTKSGIISDFYCILVEVAHTTFMHQRERAYVTNVTGKNTKEMYHINLLSVIYLFRRFSTYFIEKVFCLFGRQDKKLNLNITLVATKQHARKIANLVKTKHSILETYNLWQTDS